MDFTQLGSPVQSALFLFEIEYNEPLPDNYVLISRGAKGQSGYLNIYLKKVDNGRLVVIDAEDQTLVNKPAIY